MAKSYYGQSKRPVVEGINWGQIGTDISTKINEESKRREDLKVEIDKASNDYIRTVQNTPQGQNQGANERMSNFASSASDYMLILNRKLKSGDIKLRDYNASKANLEQGTNDMFALSKKFNTDFDNSMLRASTTASKLEVRNNAKLQEFANPSASDIIIDPITGQLSVVKMVEEDDGKGGKIRVPSSNSNDISSIFSLQNKQNQQIDKFDTKKFGEDAAKSFDTKYLKSINEGDVGTKDSILQNPLFASAKENYINAALEPTYAAQSILADGSGDYEYSENIEDKGKEGIIVLIPDPNNPNSGVLVPDLTKEQTKEAYDILDEQFMARLGYEETTSLKVDRDIKLLNKELKDFEKKYKSATADGRVTLENLRIDKFNADITAAKTIEQKRQIELKYFDEEKKLGIIKKEADITAATSAEEKRQIELKYLDEEKKLGITKKESDIEAATSAEEKRQIELNYLDENLKLDNAILKKKLEAASKKESTALKDYSSYVTNQYTITEEDIADEDKAEANLIMAYGDLGFKFDTNTFFTDAILITSPDGETTTTILLDSPNAEQSIHNFINLNTPIEDIGRLSKSGKLPNSEKKKGNVDAFGNPI